MGQWISAQNARHSMAAATHWIAPDQSSLITVDCHSNCNCCQQIEQRPSHTRYVAIVGTRAASDHSQIDKYATGQIPQSCHGERFDDRFRSLAQGLRYRQDVPAAASRIHPFGRTTLSRAERCGAQAPYTFHLVRLCLRNRQVWSGNRTRNRSDLNRLLYPIELSMVV